LIYTQNNLEKCRQEAEELLIEGNEEIVMRVKIMHEPQTINSIKIFCHLFEPIDYSFFLAIIGSIGAGIATPLLFRISSDVYYNIGNTRETRNIRAPPAVLQMIKEMINDSIRSSMNTNIRRQLIFGIISFVSNFLNLTVWSLIGNRCSLKLIKTILLFFYLKSKAGSILIILMN
jgi:hypothetical protein